MQNKKKNGMFFLCLGPFWTQKKNPTDIWLISEIYKLCEADEKKMSRVYFFSWPGSYTWDKNIDEIDTQTSI